MNVPLWIIAILWNRYSQICRLSLSDTLLLTIISVDCESQHEILSHQW